jgi:hypothetical protein
MKEVRKTSLGEMKTLSRSEMKKIMAGGGSCNPVYAYRQPCTSDTQCAYGYPPEGDCSSTLYCVMVSGPDYHTCEFR